MPQRRDPTRGLRPVRATLAMDEIEHFNAVERAALADEPAPDAISASWLRSANRYHVELSSQRAPSVLSATELKGRREPLARLVHVASGELDNLYGLVREAGYVVLLCDTQGVAIDYRGDDNVADAFKHWGIWLGGVWAEDIEGTNGIGTCIEERRPITVHLDQHFRARHIGLSCSGAPIFDADGELLAVVDVSAMNPSLSGGSHLITGPLTISTARRIEERVFRDTHRKDWIVALSGDGEEMMLAVDRDARIVGADRRAREALGLKTDQMKEGVSLWRFFARNVPALRAGGFGDRAVTLSWAADADGRRALITPPYSQALGGVPLAVHTRPREGLLSSGWEDHPATLSQGGLGAGAIRRVRDFVDAHLAESINVACLAAVAGLSVFHFSREFKRSLGVTPHNYLVTRRIRRARELLETTDLSLSDIARASGFADQGHMARHFRSLVGSTPRQYRLLRR